MGTPRGLRTSAELSPQPSFPTPPPPVFLLQLRHFLPVVRPWWSVFAPFTSLAAAASAKDKAEASAAAAANTKIDTMGKSPPAGGRRLTRTTQQANHAPSPSEWGMRVGAAYTQTGVLAKRRVKGSAGEIEELGRELELARASPPSKAGTRREAGTATQVP